LRHISAVELFQVMDGDKKGNRLQWQQLLQESSRESLKDACRKDPRMISILLTKLLQTHTELTYNTKNGNLKKKREVVRFAI